MTIRSALAYSFGSRYIATAVQLVSTLILARLLSPEEIGIYSVGASAIMIANALRDFGTSNYVIQETELTLPRLRTAFTLTVGIAWSLAILIFFAATPIGNFYSEPGVTLVMQVMAINFALIPLGSIGGAIMKRNMRFQALMYIAVLSTLVNSLSAILFASLGFGFISLAWSAILGTATTVCGNWIAERKAFVMRPSLSERNRVLAFSLRSSASSIATEAGHAAPDVVLGRTLGMEGTGLFSRALGYVQMFERFIQDSLHAVMLPYLAEQVRSGGDIRAKLRDAAPNIAAVTLLVVSLIATLAEPAFNVLFGPQWNAAIPAAQLLCAGMALRCLSPTLSAGMVASGRIANIMRVSLTATTVKFFLLIVLSPYGLTYAAAGFVGAEALGVSVLLWQCRKANIFGFLDYAKVILRVLPPVMASCATAWLLTTVIPFDNSVGAQLMRLGVSGSGAVLLWIVLIWVTDAPPKSELLRLGAAVMRRRGA